MSPQAFRVVAAYFFAFMALGTITASIGPSLPFLAARTGVSIEVASGMFSAKALGFLIGSFIAGRVIERIRAHGMLQMGLAVAALSVVAIPVSPEYGVVLAFLFVAGLFVGSVDVGANILIVWQMKERVAPFLTGLHFIWGLGALLAPIIVVQLNQRTGSLLAPFAVIAAMLAASTILFLRLPTPPPIHAKQAIRAPLALRPLATLMVMLFLAGVMELSLAGFIFTYVYEGGLGNEQQAGWINSSFYAALTATRLILAFLLLRFANRTILGWGLTLVIVSCVMVLLLPKLLSVIWCGVVLCGIGQAAMFPLTLSIAPQYLPAEGRVTSFMFLGASIGFVAMPWLVGQLYASSFPGPEVVWYFTGGAALLFAALLLVLIFTPKYGRYAVPVPQPAAGH